MVTLQIATIPSRQALLKESIKSLYDQVDEIYVMLNGNQVQPDILDTKHKIHYTFLRNEYGDAAKIYDLDKREGFIALVDDDLEYPCNYISYMLSKYNQHKGSIITLHGKVWQKPVRRAHGGYRENYHCLHTVVGDHIVETGGTGVMLFHTVDLKINVNYCLRPNMLDIWIGKRAKELGVKIIVVEHRAGWLRYLSPLKTIWNSHTKEDEAYQVKILRSFLK